MVSEEKIRELAYSIWEAEGRPEGQHLDHYFRAKRMLEEQEEVQSMINKMRIHPASWLVGGNAARKERYF
jgi:hypothetical protein